MTDQKLTGADRHPLHSDSELIRRWLYAQVTYTCRGRVYLWSKVSRVFGVGSTSAVEICERHGYDPEKYVRAK